MKGLKEQGNLSLPIKGNIIFIISMLLPIYPEITPEIQEDVVGKLVRKE